MEDMCGHLCTPFPAEEGSILSLPGIFPLLAWDVRTVRSSTLYLIPHRVPQDVVCLHYARLKERVAEEKEQDKQERER
ncbi:hypothetical protein ACQP3C_30185, partial [Escherichia coli]